ncbi:adenosylcobinamide-GDP ribazoletransferase [Thalassotalea insulae]|uniref:Adenosylcobinamide-GDP ribazoletransferase n=1 Tax=Thalassotalea insulae TaxID=2056778 RepID=A0ABQ6GTK6_9GAMM|nr:adenosylcobinamide-GDP ribazoletransferase [Thalassotalea insulae]GLX79242.1 adenosylcobinamide-GDP ribazoletransferase [Thalassotalea insulae]
MAVLLSRRRQVEIRRQWQLLCLAIMFFTRLPVGGGLIYSEQRMNQANRYFSLVGLLLGLLVAFSYQLLAMLFPIALALVLTLIISVLLTGAFHEDGLADMADGIGGGYSPQARLTIMKDSRIGTFGAISLLLALALKFVLWLNLAQQTLLLPSVIVAYSLSRALAASFIYNTPYVSDTKLSKSKPLATKQSQQELVILFSVALISAVILFNNIVGFYWLLVKLVLILMLFRGIFRRWLIARLGGFTGDCLGAAQQLSELLIYLVVVSHLFTQGSS